MSQLHHTTASRTASSGTERSLSRQRDIAQMFDRISHTYDFLNHLFSLGIDRRWRDRAIRKLSLKGGLRVLDCGAGTGDMSLTAHRFSPGVVTVLLDPSQAMLSIADSKAELLSPSTYALVRGVAELLPFPNESFDRFMVAFGIRNFVDLERGLSELFRILTSGGRGVILEFTPDRSPLIDRVFRWYMYGVMRLAGAAISRDPDAYTYLFRTVSNFASSEELSNLFERVGFVCQENRRLSLGVAHLFVLQKP